MIPDDYWNSSLADLRAVEASIQYYYIVLPVYQFKLKQIARLTEFFSLCRGMDSASAFQFCLSAAVSSCQQRRQIFHVLAAAYLADELHLMADFGNRQRLRSAASSSLIVCRPSQEPFHRRWQAFPVAAARSWNSLLLHATLKPSLPVFKSTPEYLPLLTSGVSSTGKVGALLGPT